jgi:hypothetical protein
MFGILHPESTEPTLSVSSAMEAAAMQQKNTVVAEPANFTGLPPKVVQVLCGEHLEVQAAETIRLSTVGEDG